MKISLIVLAVLALYQLQGCGGSDDTYSSTSTTTERVVEVPGPTQIVPAPGPVQVVVQPQVQPQVQPAAPCAHPDPQPAHGGDPACH